MIQSIYIPLLQEGDQLQRENAFAKGVEPNSENNNNDQQSIVNAMQEEYMRHDTNEGIQSHCKSDLDLESKLDKLTNKKIINVVFNGYSTTKNEFEAEASNDSPSTMICISSCFGINEGHSTFN